MKKILLTFMVTLFIGTILTGCNKTIFDTTYEYDYAIICLPDGTIIEGTVEEWCDYEGEQLQVKIDGNIYLTSSYNCTLINKKDN